MHNPAIEDINVWALVSYSPVDAGSRQNVQHFVSTGPVVLGITRTVTGLAWHFPYWSLGKGPARLLN